MKKEKKIVVPITQDTLTYLKIGSSYYEMHVDVYKLIQLLLKENKRKARHERFEA